MRGTNRNLVKVLIIKFFGTFGSEMFSFAVSLYILQKTGSAMGMGISLITGPMITICATPIVGYVVDTYNRKLVMCLAQLGTIAALLLFAFCFVNWPKLYFVELVVLIAVLSLTDSVLTTSLQASLVHLFKMTDLQRANSLNQSVSSLAEFIAPILGALIYTLTSLETFSYLEVMLEAIALLVISTLVFTADTQQNEAEAQDQPQDDSVVMNFVQGMRYLMQNKRYLLLSISSGLINFFFATLNLGLPFLIVHRLRLSNSQYGITESAFAGGMFLGGLILSQLHFKTALLKVAYFSLALFSLIVTLMGLPAALPLAKVGYGAVFIVLNCLLGGLLIFSNTPVDVYMQQHIPEKMQGRIFTLDEAMSTLLMPLGTILFGFLFDRFDVSLVFVLGGLPMLILSVFVLIVLKKWNGTEA